MLPVRNMQNYWLPEIFNDFFGNEWTNKTNVSSPAMNIMESENEFKVEIAAPGMTKEDVKVKLNEDDQLVITFEKKEEKKEEKKGKYLRKDFSYTNFQQSLILPDNVDIEKIDAKVQCGVLQINIPKLQPVEQRKQERVIELK